MKKKINLKEAMEELRFENELRKIKLNLEHGAQFYNLDEGNIPAEIEKGFLDQVEQFEIAYSSSKLIQVYEFIGKPKLKSIVEIPAENVKFELDVLTFILSENNIRIDSICEVEEAEMYRFITEELFFEEIEEIRIEGMMRCYIYEEFHPNHDFDIRNSCTELIVTLLDKECEINPTFSDLAFSIETKKGLVSKEDFIESFIKIKDSYSVIECSKFEIESVVIDTEVAKVYCNIEYSMVIEGSHERLSFSGKGEVGLIMEYGYWAVNKVDIPGLSL